MVTWLQPDLTQHKTFFLTIRLGGLLKCGKGSKYDRCSGLSTNYQMWVPGTQANQKGRVLGKVSWKDVACALMVLDLPTGLHSPFLPAGRPGAAGGGLFWRSESSKPLGPSG